MEYVDQMEDCDVETLNVRRSTSERNGVAEERILFICHINELTIFVQTRRFILRHLTDLIFSLTTF